MNLELINNLELFPSSIPCEYSIIVLIYFNFFVELLLVELKWHLINKVLHYGNYDTNSLFKHK